VAGRIGSVEMLVTDRPTYRGDGTMIPIPDAPAGRLLPAFTTAAEVAIITGDADRIGPFADAVGNLRNAWRVREIKVAEVKCDEHLVLIASHGMGGPSAALVVEELVDSGIRHIIRIGTCGPLQPYLEPGMVVITSGAVRDDGTSTQYLPVQVPAVPDPLLLQALCRAADDRGTRYRLGLTHCKDAYYCREPSRMLLQDTWRERWRMLRTLGVLATEGEAAAVFAVASIRSVRAAAIFVVGGDPGLMRTSLIDCAVAAVNAGKAMMAAG